MQRKGFKAAAVGLACLAVTANAQEAQPAAQDTSPVATCIADPPNPNEGEARPQTGAADNQNEAKSEKPSVAKDVGGAAGGTAGQIAGAAVAGPIGAAAVGVVGDRVGRAIGSVVKGDKKKKERKEAQQQAATMPVAKCAPVVATPSPGR